MIWILATIDRYWIGAYWASWYPEVDNGQCEHKVTTWQEEALSTESLNLDLANLGICDPPASSVPG
jgi:hypothetical protein